MSTEEEESPLIYNLCHKSFTRSDSVKRHKEGKHFSCP